VSIAPWVRRQLYSVAGDPEFGGDLLAGLARRGQLVRVAQFAHDSSAERRFRPAADFIVPSSPTSGPDQWDSFSGNTPRVLLPIRVPTDIAD